MAGIGGLGRRAVAAHPGAASATPITPATGNPAAAPKRPSAGCSAQPAVAVGETTVNITAGGEPGLYIRHVPPGYTGTKPLPLVIDLHGYSETAAIHTKITGLGAYGDSHGFVTITPAVNQKVPNWNTAIGGKDLAFFGGVLDQVEKTLCVDQTRVFVAGFSNGAFLASAVACEYADRVAAVAPVSGIQTGQTGGRPSRPVPVVTFHGTSDPFVSYTGGLGPSALKLPAADGSGKTIGQSGAAATLTKGPTVPQIVASWAKRNGCKTGPGTAPTQKTIASDVTLFSYPCTTWASVEFYRITGGGHAWPGSPVSRSIASIVGRTTFSIDANAIIWSFFQAHPLVS